MQLSWRLRWLNRWLRRIVKPRLRKTSDPAEAQKTLGFVAGLVFRKPPFLRHYIRPGGLHWFVSGPCRPDKAILYFHGGGYVAGSPDIYAGMLGRLSRLSRIETCAPIYRLASQSPAPAAFEDGLAAWDRLMRLGFAPQDIVIGGDSAGGGLALAVLAKLCQRGTPPAGCFVLSPCVDFAMTGQSLTENKESEMILPVDRFQDLSDIVLGDLPADDPRISPLYADFPGGANVLIHYSKTEILRSDAERMADHLRSFGSEVTTFAHPNAPHVWQLLDGWIPEARASLRDVARFAQSCFDETSR